MGCFPWFAVFDTELEYLEHQSTRQHSDTCRTLYRAWTGECQEGGQGALGKQNRQVQQGGQAAQQA